MLYYAPTYSFVQLKESDNGMDYSSVDYESMSKRSWTDLLLRIYKVNNIITCSLCHTMKTKNKKTHLSNHKQTSLCKCLFGRYK